MLFGALGGLMGINGRVCFPSSQFCFTFRGGGGGGGGIREFFVISLNITLESSLYFTEYYTHYVLKLGLFPYLIPIHFLMYSMLLF